ncbi:MAG: AAA family ATPase [Planctomycetia bacterium]
MAILRALVVDPERLFLDEPTSALDPEMTAEVLEMIGELKDQGTRFVLVTHEMGFARRVAGEAWIVAVERRTVVVPVDRHRDRVGDERSDERADGRLVEPGRRGGVAVVQGRGRVVHGRILAKKPRTSGAGQASNIIVAGGKVVAAGPAAGG